MKAQRRHELHRNELGVELAKFAAFVRKWRAYIVWTLALGALAVLTVIYVVRSGENKRRGFQNTYDRLAMEPPPTPQAFVDEMKTLADSGDKQLAAMATVQIGISYYNQFLAAGGSPSDPQQKELADQSAAYFRRAIRDFPDQPLAVAQAHMGLAKLAESAGDLAAAAGEYDTVVAMKGLEGEPVVLEAQQAQKDLDRLKKPVRMATTAPAGTPGPSDEPALTPATE